MSKNGPKISAAPQNSEDFVGTPKVTSKVAGGVFWEILCGGPYFCTPALTRTGPGPKAAAVTTVRVFLAGVFNAAVIPAMVTFRAHWGRSCRSHLHAACQQRNLQNSVVRSLFLTIFCHAST